MLLREDVWRLSISTTMFGGSVNAPEEGLHVGPDLLGLCTLEVPEDALGPVVGQHRLRVGLQNLNRIVAQSGNTVC